MMRSPFEGDNLNAARTFLVNLQAPFKIFNCEDEDEYNIEQDIPNVTTFAFQTGCPPSIEGIIDVSTQSDSFLHANQKSVVIFHCKSGECLYLCCFLCVSHRFHHYV